MNTSHIIKNVPFALITLVLSACATPSAITLNPSSQPNLSFFHTLKQQTPVQVQLTSNKTNYQIDEVMQFQIQSNINGRVWLLQVDANDTVTVLYPYQSGQSNTIYKKQTLTLFDSAQHNEFYASAPTGISSIIAVVAPFNKSLDEIFAIQDNRIAKVAFDTDKDWNFAKVDLVVKP